MGVQARTLEFHRQRSPEIGALLRDRYQQLVVRLADLLRRQQEAGLLAPELDPQGAATALFALVPGFVVHQQLVAIPPPRRTCTRSGCCSTRALLTAQGEQTRYTAPAAVTIPGTCPRQDTTQMGTGQVVVGAVCRIVLSSLPEITTVRPSSPTIRSGAAQ